MVVAGDGGHIEKWCDSIFTTALSILFMKKENIIKIKEKTVFEFGHKENAEMVAIALCSAGYFCKIIQSNYNYLVYVYTDRI